MGDNSSDLIRVREPERTEDEMMAGLNIRVTQPVPYIQSDKIVQPLQNLYKLFRSAAFSY